MRTLSQLLYPALRTPSTRRRRMSFAVLLLGLLPGALAGQGIHLGVGTCANSTCHGAKTSLPGSVVEQNEFAVWSQYDKHSKSFAALTSERGQAIASHLGLGGADKAPQCLSCHADNPPAALRGKGFSVKDGVSCEACHGGASDWLGVHASGVNTHAENVAAGMYPTDDPTARAKLCLGCHLFQDEGPSQHRYYAAGHPRLRFELDTYTEERPGHHRIDADYRRRKPGSYGSRAWLLGQTAAARKIVEQLLETSEGALWPDYTVFACFGCHRKFGDGQANTAGLPPLQDAPIQLTALALSTLDSASGKPLAEALAELDKAFAAPGAKGWRPAATRLATKLAAIEKELRARGERPEDARLLYQGLLTRAVAGEFPRHHMAEQVTYALATLRLADPALAGTADVASNKALDALFAAAGMTSGFEAGRWREAAQGLAVVLPAAAP